MTFVCLSSSSLEVFLCAAPWPWDAFLLPEGDFWLLPSPEDSHSFS